MLTSAVRVIAHQQSDYHLEFAVHPGWTHMAPQIIGYALTMMRRAGMKGMIMIKAFDYQPSVMEALENSKLDRVGSFSLLAREHWLRAKLPKRIRLETKVSLAPIANPAINLPRSLRHKRREF